jgi:hypothetical protein
MVTWDAAPYAAVLIFGAPVVHLLAAEEERDLPALPAAELDPATRATLLLALLAIILAGVGLIVMVILGARMVRRWSKFTPRRRAIGKPRPRQMPPDELLFDDDSDVGETIV